MKPILILICFGLLLGCQTAPIEKFSEVKTGMERDQVLEVLGNPNRTERTNGKEKWSYKFYKNDEPTLKQVTFDESMKVASFGDDTEELKRIEDIKADNAAVTSKKTNKKKNLKSLHKEQNELNKTFKPVGKDAPGADTTSPDESGTSGSH